MAEAAADDDLAFTNRGGYSLVHRTVFVYGALMADECIGALLRGGEISCRRVNKRPGSVPMYRRFAQRDAPSLAGAVHTGDALHSCDGVLLERLQPQEVDLIDAFMNKAFDRLMVEVTAEDGVGGHTQVEALMYVCPEEEASKHLDVAREWTFSAFRTKHLENARQAAARARESFIQEQAAEKAAQAQA